MVEAARRPSGAGRALALLLPGAPQLARGPRAGGAVAFPAWLVCLAVVLSGPGRVAGAASGSGAERLAVGVLVLGLALPWAWSYRQSARAARGEDVRGHGPFARSGVALAGLAILTAVVTAALLAPLAAPADPAFQGSLMTERLLPPSLAHPMGTDRLARDVLSRVLWGARVTLSIAVLAVGLGTVVGTAAGAVAGYAGGVVDGVVMRLVDVFLAFPRLVLLITVVAVFDPTIPLIVIVLGLTQWPATARLVRAEVMAVREREWVLAARALGYGGPRILVRHVLPAVLTPVIVAATLGVGNTIVLEAGLSFLALGPPPPTPTLGGMVDAGHDVLLDAWWLSFFPGAVIVLSVLACNLVGDGLRDVLDPRLSVGRGGGAR